MSKSEVIDAGSNAMQEAYGRRIDQVRELSDLWLGNVQRATDSGLQLAAQLARCGDAAEASLLYRAWVNECRDRLFADGRTAGELWLKLCRNEAELLMSAVSQAAHQRAGAASGLAAE
jgi:phasin protein